MRANLFSNHPKTRKVHTSGARLTFTRGTQPRMSPGLRAIDTESHLGRTP